MERFQGERMAKRVTASRAAKAPASRWRRLVAWAKRFPLVAGAGVTAGATATVLSSLQIYQILFPTQAAPPVVTAAYVESSIAALSNGGMLLADDGTRVFTSGVGVRVVFALESGESADISAVRVEVDSRVPDEVRKVIADPANRPATEVASWAGARTVDTYYVQVTAAGVQVKYNKPEGVAVDCDPNNILRCGAEGRDQQLRKDDTTYPIDLVVIYRGVPPVGVQLVATYTARGEQHEVRAKPLFVHN